MSRSYKKSNISRNAMTSSRASERKDKCIWHRKYRRIANMLCFNEKDNLDFSKENLPNKREVSNICRFSKDGKSYVSNKILTEFKNDLKLTKNLKFRK
jgi:hypothetical protein